MPPSKQHDALVIVADLLTIAMLGYLLWTYLPESLKMDVRGGAEQLRAPFTAAAVRRRERVEMMSDTIELATFGTPQAWTRRYAA